jgi:hypothetical protein
MIGYVTLGTNDLTRAAALYDALLSEIGAKRMMENDQPSNRRGWACTCTRGQSSALAGSQ